MRAKKTGTQQNANPPLSPDEITFALDIGTRSVVGILGINEHSCFRVIDFEQKFHTERSMRDGQIENINLVAATVQDVKRTLEERHKITLTRVSIAAAGRSLKTKRVCYEQEIDPTEEITPRLLQAVEYCAVGLAQEEFYAEKEAVPYSFYCVGYSIIRYCLDDYQISTVIGHKGKRLSLELIAAFLPENVVQSLYAVMRLNDLSVENLTLEPIAAINVIVPKDIRLLNIALVDIGAGTSDIAISKNGSIIAYDMVTTAGDEITEALMQHYLIDFETAEKMKLSLGDESDTKFTFYDILGNSRSDLKSKILKNIKTAIQTLGDAISNRILEINETPPLAVFLVGGGSQIPDLCKIIAQQLKINPSFVSIGGKQPFKHIQLPSEKLLNPEFITPIGIGTLTGLYKGCDFFSIQVNGKKLMLLNYGNTKVIDALLLSSIKPQNLIGISPRSITYTVNGERFVKRGKSSIPGELYVNGQPASIDTKINQGDEIIVKPAINGTQPEIHISDLRETIPSLRISIDGADLTIEPAFTRNGEPVEDDYLIKSMDKLESNIPTDFKGLNEILGPDFDFMNRIVYVNGEIAHEDTPIHENDVLVTQNKDAAVSELPSANLAADSENTNNEEITMESGTEQVVSPKPLEETSTDAEPIAFVNTSPTEIQVNINGTWHTVPTNEKHQVFFFDTLNYVDIDTKNPQGNIILKLNGQDAGYTDPVTEGDHIEIRWDTTTF